MNSKESALLFLGLLIFAGVSAIVGYCAHRKNVAEIVGYAAQRGWRYAKSDPGLVNRFVGYPFGRGYGRKVRNVLTGVHRGQAVLAFEYIHKVSGSDGEGSTTFHHTVIAVATPAVRPTLAVGREGAISKVLGIVGMRDLQLESEQFNKTFLIRTENDRFAYDILHPRMMAWMLDDERALSTPFRFERSDLVTTYQDKIELSKLTARLDYLCDILERVPSFVWTT